MKPDPKQEILNAILVDDLDRARSLVSQAGMELELLSNLLAKVENSPPPFNQLRSDHPRLVAIPTSFTCGIGCQMCSAGFHDRTSLYDDRKYFLPHDLDKLHDWVETATHVLISGVGETLGSPHLAYFLEKVSGKISSINTSGVPLNREKTILLVREKLNYLILSFDGTASVGHGSGDESYSKNFWEKVKLVQGIKKEFDSSLPILAITLAVNEENITQLDDIFTTAQANGIQIVDLRPMHSRDRELFQKSIFAGDYKIHKDEINRLLSEWNRRGMQITCCEEPRMTDAHESCFYVDNYMVFSLPDPSSPQICCGSLSLPLSLGDYPKDAFWNSFPIRYFRYLHLSGEVGKQPLSCQNCGIINPRQCAQTASELFTGERDDDKARTLYNAASLLKQNHRSAEARKAFSALLDLRIHWSLKGKAYFHLGELSLRSGNPHEALSFMELAVQYCFDHKMAFAYLYLLLLLLGEPPAPTARHTRTTTYLEKLSQTLGFRAKAQVNSVV